MPPSSLAPASPGTESVVEHGHGPRRLVLLHAAGAGPRALDRLATSLAADGWRTSAPVLAPPGHILSGDATDPFAEAIALTGHLLGRESPGPRVLFGHSMGGLIALKAVVAGTEVDRLVLYEPIVLALLDPADPDDRAALAWDRACIDDVRAEMAARRPEAAVRRFVEAYGDTSWAEIPAPARAALVARSEGLLAAAEATNAARLATADVRALQIPTLILTGSRSPAVLGRMAARLAALLPHVERVTIDGAGHMGPITHPAPIAEAVRRCLARAGLQPRGS